jgi:hypothetical protein
VPAAAELPASDLRDKYVMHRGVRRRKRALEFGLCLAAAIVAALPAAGAPIATESSGAFGLCLEARADQWIAATSERLVMEDPAASRLNDAAVAAWAVASIETCRKAAGAGDAATEERFVKHMAHWREHIDQAAQLIKQRGNAD